MNRLQILAFVSLFAIPFGISGCTSFIDAYNNIDKEKKGEAPIEDSDWVPSGFTPYNNNIALKWSSAGSYTCSYGERCAQLQVVSKDGCDNLYVELNKLDKSGNNVGYTNETTSNLAPKQKAILNFQLFGEFESVKVAEVNCY